MNGVDEISLGEIEYFTNYPMGHRGKNINESEWIMEIKKGI